MISRDCTRGPCAGVSVRVSSASLREVGDKPSTSMLASMNGCCVFLAPENQSKALSLEAHYLVLDQL